MLTTAVTPSTIEEPTLVARLRAGDEAAYEVLVRRHGAAMLAVARRLLRNEEDARDAVQEAFLHVFRAAGEFRADAKLSTWLHRIVVNTALMRLRSAGRRPEGFVADLLPAFDETGHHADPVLPLPASAEDAVGREELRARVRACVAELPAAYRAIVVLRDFEDLSTAEVASLLGISENAAKIRLHRARQALTALLRVALADGASPARSVR
jgi:RNA polymerase sigma-70 factor (ECF subfamily)